MNAVKLRANLMLLITATIWGVAFVAQSVSVQYLGPFTFNAVRLMIGSLALLPVIALLKRAQTARNNGCEQIITPERRRHILTGGVVCGTVLFVAGSLQQVGISDTTAGKAGFITALYIVLVPLFGVLLKKRIPLNVWTGVALAAGGLYLLCMKGSLRLGRGDLLVLICAVFYAVHILCIDYFSTGGLDAVRMSCLQFFVAGALSALVMLFAETPRWANIAAAWAPILYTGVFSSGVAYTLQMVAQKDTDATVASLIMSLESVFAVLSGWIILGEVLTLREAAGCLLMFAAIVLAQLPQRPKKTQPDDGPGGDCAKAFADKV
jgi:drug/metabolite transporter (DMT)-like permease